MLPTPTKNEPGTFTEFEYRDEPSPSTERLAELERAGWIFFETAGSGAIYRFYRPYRKIGPQEFKA